MRFFPSLSSPAIVTGFLIASLTAGTITAATRRLHYNKSNASARSVLSARSRAARRMTATERPGTMSRTFPRGNTCGARQIIIRRIRPVGMRAAVPNDKSVSDPRPRLRAVKLYAEDRMTGRIFRRFPTVLTVRGPTDNKNPFAPGCAATIRV